MWHDATKISRDDLLSFHPVKPGEGGGARRRNKKEEEQREGGGARRRRGDPRKSGAREAQLQVLCVSPAGSSGRSPDHTYSDTN